MKKLTMILLAVALLAGISMTQADEAKWFDMEHCAMCKPMMEVPGLMEKMTCEQYNISNGVLSVSTVPAEMMESFTKMCDAMDATGGKLMAGEKMELCGSCATLGAMFPKGVHFEKVMTSNGDIMMFTSENAEMVTELHKWADKNTEEMAKMMSAMESGHEGHEH